MNIDAVIEPIREHAKAEFPRESCGVVIVYKGRQKYKPCKNIAASDKHFVIDPADWVKAEDMGEIVAVVHSHPGIPPTPSQADLVECERTGLPWIIVNWPTGVIHQFEPSGYQAPLVGREFTHGVLDCYAVIRDYYRQELDIVLPDYDRRDRWWERGENLYLDFYEDAGFVLVGPDEPMEVHDMLVCKIASKVPNHGAVYIGDNMVLQHIEGRLSSRDIYGGWLRKITTHVMRHKEVIGR